jgi:hypothetical protein
MLHALKTEVDGKPFSTRKATEFLNITIFVVAQTFFDYFLRLAEQASLNASYRFDNSRLNDLPYRYRELDGPNVFASDISKLEVWASAKPA